jgi:predicted amidohydrolase
MKIAGVQIDIHLGQTDANVAVIRERIRETRSAGAELAVFPECAVSGYCFESADEARPHAQTIPGPATDVIGRECARQNSFAIFGMLESDNGRLFNAAVLVGPSGVIGSYRKVHLPFLGIDRFTAYGDRPFAVHCLKPGAEELRLGMNICYDSAFPEASRVLTLLGADLICLPTNWPPGAECLAANGVNIRAMENCVYYIAVNRVGTERGFRFIGQSQICDPSGQSLAKASEDAEQIIYAEVDPARARNKHCVRVPEKHEIDRLADRRPEMYGPLLEPHSLRSPGR